MENDKSKSQKLEIVQRSLLEDSKNREKYLEIRVEKGLVNEKSANERYLFSEKVITKAKELEGENMTVEEKGKILEEVVSGENNAVENTVNKEKSPKTKKSTISDANKAKEKLAKEKALAKEKEKLAKEKALVKEKEKLAKEKALAKEKEKLAKEKALAKEKEKLAKEKALAKEKEKLAKEKALAKEKEKLTKEEALTKEKEKQNKSRSTSKNSKIDSEIKKKKAVSKQNQFKEKEASKEKIIDAIPEKEDIIPVVEEKEEIANEPLTVIPENDGDLTVEKQIGPEEKAHPSIDYGEKLRRKIEAQRLLDQGFMKIDAEKTQNKDLLLKDKLSSLEEAYEESIDDKLDREIEEAYEEIDTLKLELEKANSKIADFSKVEGDLKSKNEELINKVKLITADKDKALEEVVKAQKIIVTKDQEYQKNSQKLKEADEKIKKLEEEIKNISIEKSLQKDFENNEAELKKELDDARIREEELQQKVIENEQKMTLLIQEKEKALEAVKISKQKNATALAIKYDDIFVINENSDDISKAFVDYIDNLKKEKMNFQEEHAVLTEKLLEKEQIILELSQENKSLLDSTTSEKQQENLFEKIEEKASYNVEAEIEKIKEEIDLMKKKEINTLENNEKQNNAYNYKQADSNYEIYQRIHNLEQEIYQKDQQLQLIKQKFNDIGEDSIIDPEFKKRIRRVRDMKRELNESFEEEKKFLNRNIIQVEQQINQKRLEVEVAKAKVESIEKEYAGQTDRTSLGRETYLSKRGKALIELELFEGRLQKLNDEELTSLKERYDYLIQCYDDRIDQLNQSEVEIVNYYLDEMKNDLIVKDTTYHAKYEEKEDLVRQLSDLNVAQQETQSALLQNSRAINKAIETNREIKEQLLVDKKENVERNIRRLEIDIRDKTLECNDLINKLSIINAKYVERTEAEKGIRSTDEVVKEYIRSNNDINEFTIDYRSNLDQTQEIMKKLENIEGNPDEKSESLRLKAKIQDLDILKTDLLAKIDFARKKVNTLVSNDSVLYYSKLVDSIKELKKKQDETKEYIDKLKSEIAAKTIDLEQAKEEKFSLE